MSPRKSLVMGASGFLGSHVTRQLVERGDDVRVMLRPTSSTKGIDDLDVQRRIGSLTDDDAVRSTMADRDVVFYCVVDTRAMLPDPAPLLETNVEALRRVLAHAVAADLRKFVFLSTICTVGLSRAGRPATEETPFIRSATDGAYVRTRLAAEELVIDAARRRGLPAVVMCVSNTYGPRDWQPTPHGAVVARAASGTMRFYARGAAAEVVGIEDAARAMLLAAEHGRPGQRYIVSESFMDLRDILWTAADETGGRRPSVAVPMAMLYAGAYATVPVRALLPRKVTPFLDVVRLLDLTSPADHTKAVRELGWRPAPTTEAIRRAARFYVEHRPHES
ncbi:NAD-dependent epimerase/dehydratase family protein [Mycolicibacterium baixiangningiae]|uniref:NAD-dependent epimerase/dehydratase family protein n=1 Tax=Mycolicibacterium baixiangningiae TaxID=2761578 RepID=UPI0018D13AEC|nr:NAD-dependent epimerase/dehydratase family protein [Mycolicibacterium baixiangningiae]